MIDKIQKQVFDLLEQKRVKEAFDVLKAIGKRKRRKYNLGEAELAALYGEAELAALYVEVSKATFELEQEKKGILSGQRREGIGPYQAKGLTVYEGDKAVEVAYNNYYLVDIVIKSLDKAEELAKEGEDTLLLEQVRELNKRLRQYLL